MGLFGGFLCLPVAAVFSAAFIMLACKILKDEREFTEAYKAALSYGGIMALVNFVFQFVEVSPFIAVPIYLVVWGGSGAMIYSSILEMEPGKAFLVWLTQQGMALALCLAICLPIGFATGMTGIVMKQILGSNQVAEGPDLDEDDLDMEEAPAQDAPQPSPAPEPMPQPATEGDSSQPMPEPQPVPEPQPTPETTTPTPESTTPTPESTTPTPTPTPTPESTTPTPETVPAPAVPAGPTFPPGLQGDAQRAFHEGRILDGKNYLRAALLTSDDKALWNNVRWYPGLGRPMIGLRWGIALQMAETPPAIAAPAPPDGGAAENPLLAAGSDMAELRKFTGDFGPKLVETLPKSTLDRLLGPLGEGVQMSNDVQFVGVGTDLQQVQSLARQKGVDLLLVAAVSFKVFGVNRNMDAQLTVRLLDVATEKRLWSSKMLSSNQVKAALAKGQNPFSDTVKNLDDYLEHNFQSLEKPDLDAAKIRQRADAVAREEAASPLPAMVELRYYQMQAAITPQLAETCYQRLVEIEAAGVLATGSAEERQRVVERFLPRSK